MPLPSTTNRRVDQYDDQGRFIGRTGGVEGIDYGTADQNNDMLGNQLAAYNRQLAALERGDPEQNNFIGRGIQADQQTRALWDQGKGQWGSAVAYGNPNQMDFGQPQPKPGTQASTQKSAFNNPYAGTGVGNYQANQRVYGTDMAAAAYAQNPRAGW